MKPGIPEPEATNFALFWLALLLTKQNHFLSKKWSQADVRGLQTKLEVCLKCFFNQCTVTSKQHSETEHLTLSFHSPVTL